MTPEESVAAGTALVASVRSLTATIDIERRCGFDAGTWRGLAELGALGVSSSSAGGDAIIGALVGEELGRRLVGGPIVATTLAAHALGDREATAIVTGASIATYGVDGRYPWGDRADIVLDVSGGSLRRVEIKGPTRMVGTMGGDDWLLGDAETVENLSNVAAAVAHAEVVLAAYLNGASAELVSRAADHVRARRQFGRPVGDFQAVSHPLAECFAQTSAASALTQAVAVRLASGADAAELSALALLATTRAALRTARTAHQVFGALGYSVEGGVARYANRIRQWSLFEPSSGTKRARIMGGIEAAHHEQDLG